jgi:sugar lactone lactonase YvrE
MPLVLGALLGVAVIGLALLLALPSRGDGPAAVTGESATEAASGTVVSEPALAAPVPAAAASVARAQEAVVTTLAGSGVAGFADGPGTTARFNNPAGMALDRAGNLYVADISNHRIRRVAPDGTVTTVAGTGEPGFANGPVATARFNAPIGLALSPLGALFVAERENHRLRRVAFGGDVRLFAGAGTIGRADGLGAAAQFNNPTGLAFDGLGNLYVSDFANHTIRKVTSAGVVTTLAGTGVAGFADGPGTTARFNNPAGIAIDAAGYLYVADVSNHRIRRVAPDGTVTTVAGTGEPGFADGPALSAKFAAPSALAVAGDGTVYVADYGNHRIRQIDRAGTVTTVAGTGQQGYADGPGSTARFDTPVAVTVDDAGHLYATEFGNRIRRITLPTRP